MSKETDFLVRYPFLETVRQKASELLDLLNEVCSLQETPDSGWRPALHDASMHVAEALAAEVVLELDKTLLDEFREALRLTEYSFDHGESWLLDARSVVLSAVEHLEAQIASSAEDAFGEWGAHFFAICAPMLSPDYFDPTSYAVGAARRRPAYERDHLWLVWKLRDGLGPARIRDRWNKMPKDERHAICPELPGKIGWREDGREVVKKGLRKAGLEAREAKSEGVSQLHRG